MPIQTDKVVGALDDGLLDQVKTRFENESGRVAGGAEVGLVTAGFKSGLSKLKAFHEACVEAAKEVFG